MQGLIRARLAGVCNAKQLFGQQFQLQHRRTMKTMTGIPQVSATSIRRALKMNNVEFEELQTNFAVKCMLCSTRCEHVSNAKLYINKKTGSFVCTCSYSNQWTEFNEFVAAKNEKDVRDSRIVAELSQFKLTLKSLKKSTLPVAKMTPESFTEMLDILGLPNTLHQSTFAGLDVRINDSHSKLYFPLHNASQTLVGYQTLEPDGKTGIEPHSCVLPISGVLSKSASPTATSKKAKTHAVIVPTIADFLLLLNNGLSATIVCLPQRLVTLSQFLLPCFEAFTRLTLWLGTDSIASDAARVFAGKLGEGRCHVVLTAENGRANSLPSVSEQQDFQAVIGKASPIWHRAITTFASLRKDVLSDLMNIEKVQGIKWTRFPTLSKILKGHRRGELTVFTGPTGSGKTTFISEYSLDLAMQGVTTLWGSFEIRNERLARTMLQQLAGLQLDEHIDQYDRWADAFEQLPMFFMTFHGQQTIKVVMEAVEHAVYVHDIAHVVIDNVQFMLGIGDESARFVDRFWRQDAVIAAFRSFATRHNCHVTLVIHPRKEREDEELTTSSIFGGAKAAQEADNILIIQDKRLVAVRGKKFLQVAKNRYSGDLGVMPLDFQKHALSYAQQPKKVVVKKERGVDELGRGSDSDNIF